MEAWLVLACGCVGFVAAFVAVLPRGGRAPAGAGVRMQRMLRLLARLARLPLVSWLLGLSSWASVSAEVARAASARGVRLVREEAAALVILACTGVAVGCGVLAWSPLGLVVGAVGSVAAVPALASTLDRRRRMELAREMPDVFRTLAVAMGSGQTMSQAIAYVGSHEGGYAGESFSRASLMLTCGSSVDEALGAIAKELDAPGVGLLTTALRVSHQTGSPLRDLFTRSARLVERASEFERLLSVKTAQVRLSVRIVCVMPVAMVGLLSVISPDFRAGIMTTAGIVSLALASLMDVAALAIVRRLAKGVL